MTISRYFELRRANIFANSENSKRFESSQNNSRLGNELDQHTVQSILVFRLEICPDHIRAAGENE